MRLLNRFAAAVRFLTIMPLPGQLGCSHEDMIRSMPFFPLVGLLLGIVSGGCAWVAFRVLPAQPAAVVCVAVLALFSGALHLDGLADSADGFFSSRPRERILEIMRDSRIGAMGVVALVLVFLVKVSSLASLSHSEAVKAAVLMPFVGRVSLPAMMAMLPYARTEGGLGSLFYSGKAKGIAMLHGLAALAIVVLVAGGQGVIAFCLSGVVLLLFAGLCRSKIGGATGDTLGAACELTEACMSLGFCLHFCLKL